MLREQQEEARMKESSRRALTTGVVKDGGQDIGRGEKGNMARLAKDQKGRSSSNPAQGQMEGTTSKRQKWVRRQVGHVGECEVGTEVGDQLRKMEVEKGA